MRKRSKVVAITFEFTAIYSVIFADSLNLLLSEYMLLRVGMITFRKAHLLAVLLGRAIVSQLTDLPIGHTACSQLTDKSMLRCHSIDKLLSFQAVKL